MNIAHLSDSEFAEEVLQSRQPVLVDFWAPWCAPCQMLIPILDEIAKEYSGKIKVCKVNVDENQATAAKFQILSIPALLFFKDGKIEKQIAGLKSAGEIKKTINALLLN